MAGLVGTLHYGSTRRLLEIALLLGLLGGIAIAVGVVNRLTRPAALVGGLLVAVAFALAIVAVHYGVSPFVRAPRHRG